MLKQPRTILFFTAVVLLGMLLGSKACAQEQPVPVSAVRAEEKPIYNSVTAGGTVEAERSYAFCTEGNAAVAAVYVQEGEAVQAGQPLWLLEPSSELRWTTSLLENAAAVLSGSEDSERTAASVAQGPVTVCAPADCTLLTVPSAGQSVPAGLTYAQAVDLAALRLRVKISEAFVAEVQAGQQANITVSATGKQYAGQVRSVAPVARQAVSLTGGQGAVTVSAVLQIDGADGSLRPGYSANAKIFVDEKAAAVVLPYEAIRQEGTEEFVYVIGADSRIHRRPVTTGYALSQAVEVTEGILPGELAVIDSPGELAEGMLAEVTA